MELFNDDFEVNPNEFTNSEIKNQIISDIVTSLSTCIIAAHSANDIFKRADKDGIVINVGETNTLEEELGKLFGNVIVACNRGILDKNNIFNFSDREYRETEELLDIIEKQQKEREENDE